MTLAQEIAGIPIALPGWTEVATYILLGLLAAALGVWIWRTLVKQKQNTLLGEIHAKNNLILLILRGYQERDEQNAAAVSFANEHYASDEPSYPPQSVTFPAAEGSPHAPQSVTFGGSHRIEGNEITDRHERINPQ